MPASSTLGEALAAGATVIAHADPGGIAVLTHGVNGLLTDARAPQQLAGTLAYALGYHEQLAPLRRAGRVLAQERFSTATLAERVLEQLHASNEPRDGHDVARRRHRTGPDRRSPRGVRPGGRRPGRGHGNAFGDLIVCGAMASPAVAAGQHQ